MCTVQKGTFIKAEHIHADASEGIALQATEMLVSTNACMHFIYNSYSHYILGHHNVKVCSSRQAE